MQVESVLPDAIAQSWDSHDFFEALLKCLEEELSVEGSAVYVWDRVTHHWTELAGFEAPADFYSMGQELLCECGTNDLEMPINIDQEGSGELSFVSIPFKVRKAHAGVVVLKIQPGKADEAQSRVLALQPMLAHAKTVFERNGLWNSLTQSIDASEHLVESIPHGVIITDHALRVLSMNQNARFLLSVTDPFFLEKGINEVFDEKTGSVLSQLAEELMASGVANETEYSREICHNEVVRMAIMPSRIIDRKGQTLGVVFICRDMMLTEQVLELRELNELKTSFLNMVSHELKTPLTAIKGGVDILGAVDEGLGEDQKAILDVVKSGADQLQSLVNDLLDLSRMQSGRVHAQKQSLRIADIVEEALATFQADRTHPVEVMIEPGLSNIDCDGRLVHKVLTNLLSNAVKYSPNGGKVNLRIASVPSWLRVEVEDTGLGISEADQKRIWESFFRTDSVSRGNIEGTGLGLSIVKKIIDLHEGKVWVKSEPGKGSVFGFSLPLARSDESERLKAG